MLQILDIMIDNEKCGYIDNRGLTRLLKTSRSMNIRVGRFIHAQSHKNRFIHPHDYNGHEFSKAINALCPEQRTMRIPHLIRPFGRFVMQLSEAFYDDDIVDTCALPRSASGYRVVRDDMTFADLLNPTLIGLEFMVEHFIHIRILFLVQCKVPDFGFLSNMHSLQEIAWLGDKIDIPRMTSLKSVNLHVYSEESKYHIDIDGYIRDSNGEPIFMCNIDITGVTTLYTAFTLPNITLHGDASSVKKLTCYTPFSAESLQISAMTNLKHLIINNSNMDLPFIPDSVEVLELGCEVSCTLPPRLTQFHLWGDVGVFSVVNDTVFRLHDPKYICIPNANHICILDLPTAKHFEILHSKVAFPALHTLKCEEWNCDILAVPTSLRTLWTGCPWGMYALGTFPNIVVLHTHLFTTAVVDVKGFSSLKVLHLQSTLQQINLNSKIRLPGSVKHIVIEHCGNKPAIIFDSPLTDVNITLVML
jgi:hypothetical protein